LERLKIGVGGIQRPRHLAIGGVERMLRFVPLYFHEELLKTILRRLQSCPKISVLDRKLYGRLSLFHLDEFFWEGSGLQERSAVTAIQPTGKVLPHRDLPEHYFGGGIVD
jgi:hypothetical protein